MTLCDIEMIATTPLNDLQLSAALQQQVKSPHRVFSTPSCYAAISVGFPDCVNIIILLVSVTWWYNDQGVERLHVQLLVVCWVMTHL